MMGDGVGTQSVMMHGASPVIWQDVPFAAMEVEQHESAPAVPGTAPQPGPPHCPQFSAQLQSRRVVVRSDQVKPR